ncbi:MAG: MgtC/SapB family protein [Candidatus Hermodarchaeota archaeon]
MQELLLSSDIIVRFLIGFAVGALIGLERQKRMVQESTGGVRSFGLLSLFGTITAYTYTVTGNMIVLVYAVAVSTILIGVQITYKMFKTMRKGMTTSIVLAIAFMLGVLVGLDDPPAPGQLVGPLQVLAMTVAFLVFLVLGFKQEFQAVVAVISREEMISAAELGVLILFFWPLIPETVRIGTVMLPAQQIYLLVILLLSISFVNYILVKKFGSRGPLVFGFFGGFANSEATVSSLAEFHVKTSRRFPGRIALSAILANVAMILRNSVIVVILDPTLQIFKYYTIPLAILVAGAIYRSVRESRRSEDTEEGEIESALGSPFEFGAAIRFAVVFTSVSFLSLFLQNVYADVGVIAAALLGGFASAGAIVATVGIGFAGATIGLSTAVLAVIIATTTSVLNKVVYVYLSDRETDLVKLVAKDSLIMAAGVVLFIIMLAGGVIPVV